MKTKTIKLKSSDTWQLGPGVTISLEQINRQEAVLRVNYQAGISIEKQRAGGTMPTESSGASALAEPAQSNNPVGINRS